MDSQPLNPGKGKYGSYLPVGQQPSEFSNLWNWRIATEGKGRWVSGFTNWWTLFFSKQHEGSHTTTQRHNKLKNSSLYIVINFYLAFGEGIVFNQPQCSTYFRSVLVQGALSHTSFTFIK